MKKPDHLIYMDHSATTPVRAEVVEAMNPYWSIHYGNASSIHEAGRSANVALTKARRSVAARIGAGKNEIIFTAGGTESDNAALRGIALARRAATGANRLVISSVEHHAVLHTAEDLAANFGFELTILPVDKQGQVNLDDVWQTLESGADVALVSVMLANNEIGTIQPVSAIGQVCREFGVPLHTDAVQAAGKLPLNVDELRIDALSASAHKFYGPKGCGFLYLRRGTPFQSSVTGGSHESSRRAGTENVPLIVGLTKALELAEAERTAEAERLRSLRDRLIEGILLTVPDSYVTGSRCERVPHLASFVICGVEAEGVLIGLDLAGIAASSGSACTSGAQKPSHVLEAIGVSNRDAVGGLRLSLGSSNTLEDVEYVLDTLPAIVHQIRNFTPVAV